MRSLQFSRYDFIDCIRCRGDGRYVECLDDICNARGRCMHGDNTCALCEGLGYISPELAERWRQRDAFESVELSDSDLYARGKLHAVARERYEWGDSR